MRLDPRSPLVVSTHDLGRRPGTMRGLELTVPAPAGLGVELIGVSAGSPIDLSLRLEAVMEGVLVSGKAEAGLVGECSRCLEQFADRIAVDLQELYAYPESDVEDDEASRLEGEFLDLEPTLRDSVVLALPFRPVCRADCPGLCAECGVSLKDEPDHAHPESSDPRWAALSVMANDAAGRTGNDKKE